MEGVVVFNWLYDLVFGPEPQEPIETVELITWEAHEAEMDRILNATTRIMAHREDYISSLEQMVKDLDAALRSR